MTSEEKVFKYKLDFYYQSALIYLVTLIRVWRDPRQLCGGEV